MADIPEKDVKAGLARIGSTLANPKAHDMIMSVLPAVAKKYLTPERISKIVLTAASRNPRLAVCTPASVLKAIMEFAPLGLEIGGPLNHVYLVPFYNSRIGAFEAVGIPGYMGYIELAYRTGKVQSICADVIREGDRFKHVRHADKDEFEHEKTGSPDADIIGFYCRAIFEGGGHHIEVMHLEDVEKIRQRSKAKDAGPWKTDYNEMGKKTAVRRGSKYWPKSWEIATLAELDNRVDTGAMIDASAVIEATAMEKPQTATDALADRIEGQLESGNEPPDDDAPPMPPDPEEPEVPAMPDESSGKAGVYKHTGDDEKKAEYITNYCLDQATGEVSKAAEMLVTLTAFRGRDKKMVPGVDSCDKMSAKRLAVTYGKVKELIKKSGGEVKDNDEPFA